MKEKIKFEHVSFCYEGGSTEALSDIHLTIREGEFVGIIGPNAAGKSSVCRLCNGLIPHSFDGALQGNILVQGLNTTGTKTAQLAKMVGSVFADPEAQLSQMTVWEEIAFGVANLSVPREEIMRRVEETLRLMNISDMRDRSPFTLSGGEQQRVAIASVLAMQPDILVLDEPTSNLDPQGTEDVFRTVHRLNSERGLTVIMVEHEIELLAKYASRIILMDQGKIIMDGAPGEVFHHAQLFQRIGMNIPQVTETALILDQEYNSWNAPDYPLTLEKAYEMICGVAKGF